MNAQGAALAVGQNLEISPSLGRLYDSKRILLAWNLQILSVVACDLEKHSTVGSTFVGLSRGVEETRAKTQNRCDMLAVANSHAQFLQQGFVLGIHLDVAEDGKVVPCAKPSQVCAQIVPQLTGGG